MNPSSRRAPLWSIAGALAALAMLGWAFSRVDYHRLLDALRDANPWLVLMVPLSIVAEQLLRAWKWRQLLFALRPLPTLRLFGALMAGYFASILIPFGLSPFARSWLVARLEGLKMGAVLATVTIDRLIDGVVFTGFVAIVLVFAIFPDPTGNIRVGLTIGGAGSLILFILLLLSLARYDGLVAHLDSRIMRLVNRLPGRWIEPIQKVLLSFAEGIVWPRETWRSYAILLVSISIKLVAIMHFIWAGLAFGVLLQPLDYVFLIVFLGFLIILIRLLRIPGGFLLGAIFAFDLLGVPDALALAIVLLVQVSSLIVIACVGTFTLWRSGISLYELRLANATVQTGELDRVGPAHR